MALSAALAAGLVLASCDKPASVAVSAGHHGRYAGIGTFSVGALWSKMAVDAPKDARAATIADDEHVIVVVDTDTGEVRECGDYSGRCVSMNPWTKAIGGTPVAMSAHAADVRAEGK